MSVRPFECTGSVWALRTTADSAVLHFHLCRLRVSGWGFHLVFIFYQNVSIFVGEVLVVSPRLGSACEKQMNFSLLALISLLISRRVRAWEARECTQRVLALGCLVIWQGVCLGGHALVIKPGLSSPLVTFYHALRSKTTELGRIKGFGDWNLKDFQTTFWHSQKNLLTGPTQGKPVWCHFTSLPFPSLPFPTLFSAQAKNRVYLRPLWERRVGRWGARKDLELLKSNL